jgi:NADH-quinone oxidoreductase subunit A
VWVSCAGFTREGIHKLREARGKERVDAVMLQAYAPILILLGVSLLNAVGMVALSHLVSPYRPTPAKLDPYESGMIPLGNTRERFSIKFYMVAILFIVFDIETVFLIPWAVWFRRLGLFGFVEMLVFIFVLLVGFIYIWKKGALEWE